VESHQEVVVAYTTATEEKTALQAAQECGEALGRALLDKGASAMLAITRALVGATEHHVAPSAERASQPDVSQSGSGTDELRRGKKRELGEESSGSL